jgi:four helix bundle protein
MSSMDFADKRKMMEEMNKPFQPLRVLELAKQTAEDVYLVTGDRRFERESTLKNQLRRAVLSVPSNIAEGEGRRYSQEGIRFFKIAIASAEESKIQLSLALRIGIVPPDKANKAIGDLSSVCRMLNKLISSRASRGSKLE